MPQSPAAQLERKLRFGEFALDLAEGALVIARLDYPQLDAAHYLRRIDTMADDVRERVVAEGDDIATVQALNQYLFTDLGFTGNRQEYLDPRNSFLNEVMDRRTGIPISLSVLYLAVGERLRLPLAGVSFPGHFLVKLTVAEGDVILDPFNGGASLGLEDLVSRARSALGEQLPVAGMLEQLLAPASKRQILARMLRNLKGIYQQQDDIPRLLHVLDMLLAIEPDNAGEIRDRGRAYQSLQHFTAAVADYRRYLELAPEAADAPQVKELVVDLRPRATGLH